MSVSVSVPVFVFGLWKWSSENLFELALSSSLAWSASIEAEQEFVEKKLIVAPIAGLTDQ